MAYVRKTRDEYEIQGFYGSHRWEHVTTETLRTQALARLREYQENEPNYAHRIVRRRVRITPKFEAIRIVAGSRTTGLEIYDKETGRFLASISIPKYTLGEDEANEVAEQIAALFNPSP